VVTHLPFPDLTKNNGRAEHAGTNKNTSSRVGVWGSRRVLFEQRRESLRSFIIIIIIIVGAFLAVCCALGVAAATCRSAVRSSPVRDPGSLTLIWIRAGVRAKQRTCVSLFQGEEQAT
jgi:hypothetical protein